MKTGLLLSLLLLSAFAADDEPYTGPSEKDVIILDKDNLESTIYDSQDPWLLMLYAPWCGHCKTLRPEFAKLATNVLGEIKVAKIDASTNRQFDKTYGLKGYPHIVFIPAGPKDKEVYYVHEGARTADSIANWAREKINESRGFLVERLTSEAKWKQNCIDLNIPLCVIAFLPHILDSSKEERAIYLEAIRGTVNSFRDKPISFMWTQAGDHQEVQDQFNMNFGYPSVILINPLKNAFSIMKSSFTEEHFEGWLNDILAGKGKAKFGQYNKELTFAEIEVEDEPEPEIEINEGEDFEGEL